MPTKITVPIAKKNKVSLITQEYQNFVKAMVSDLNVPLQEVKNLTQLLIDCRPNEITEEGEEYIGFLKKSVPRLDEIQEALVVFSLHISDEYTDEKEMTNQTALDLITRVKKAVKTEAEDDKAIQVSKECQEFSYIALHDISAPLRHIRQFMALLVGTWGSVPTAIELEYLDQLNNTLDNLNEIKKNLQTLSHFPTDLTTK